MSIAAKIRPDEFEISFAQSKIHIWQLIAYAPKKYQDIQAFDRFKPR